MFRHQIDLRNKIISTQFPFYSPFAWSESRFNSFVFDVRWFDLDLILVGSYFSMFQLIFYVFANTSRLTYRVVNKPLSLYHYIKCVYNASLRSRPPHTVQYPSFANKYWPSFFTRFISCLLLILCKWQQYRTHGAI